MRALIFIHHPDEGPGLLNDLLKMRGWEVEELKLWQEGGMPDPASFQLLILTGGPMSVNEEDIYPFLSREKEFVSPCLGRESL